MAKFGKAQYEILTEAFGEALADLKDTGSPLLENVGLRVASKVAASLKYDNDGFDERRFITGVINVAELSALSKKGIH